MSVFISACNSTKNPPENQGPSQITTVPKSTSEYYDLTTTADVSLVIAGSNLLPFTPVLTDAGLNLIPSAVLEYTPQTTILSSVRFDRFKPAGDIIRATFKFVGSNVEAEAFPILSMLNYVKKDQQTYFNTKKYSPLIDLTDSGEVSRQVDNIVKSTESLQYEVRVTSGDKSMVTANANDLIMTSILVESYQTEDADWNNANYTVGWVETCSYDVSELTDAFSIVSNSGIKTISNSIKLGGQEIASFSVNLDLGEIDYSGLASVNTEEFSGDYPLNVSLTRRGDIVTHIKLGRCDLENYISNDMLDSVADSAYNTEMQMDFKAISELDPTTQALSKLSVLNNPRPTNKGLRIYPQGLDLLKSYSDPAVITMPSLLIAPDTQMVRYNLKGLVEDLDIQACGEYYFSLRPEIDGEARHIFMYPLIAQNSFEESIVLFVNGRKKDIKMHVDAEVEKCQPSADTAYPELYVSSLAVEQLSFDVHPLTLDWNVTLAGTGGTCEGKTFDSEIKLDLSSEGTTLALSDGSNLWVQLNESGTVTWSWDIDGSTTTTSDDFFYGNFLWSTMLGEQGCSKRMSLYRDI